MIFFVYWEVSWKNNQNKIVFIFCFVLSSFLVFIEHCLFSTLFIRSIWNWKNAEYKNKKIRFFILAGSSVFNLGLWPRLYPIVLYVIFVLTICCNDFIEVIGKKEIDNISFMCLMFLSSLKCWFKCHGR